MKVRLLLVLAASSVAHASSPIDCGKVSNPAERTVCRTPSLLQADARMTAYFDIATQFTGMGVRGNLMESQTSISI